MTEILCQAIMSAGLILVAVLQLRTEKYRKKQDAARAVEKQQHEEQRKDDLGMSIAKGKVLATVGELANVTSIAVTGGHVNGNVEAAQKAYSTAIDEYNALQLAFSRKYLKADM